MPAETTQRQQWLGVLARAELVAVTACLAGAPPLPAHTRLRGPEIGLVMLRGRAGGGGAAFNLGEMTVARCSVRAEGFVGHGYVAGRDMTKAETMARLDAALQDPARFAALWEVVIAPLAGQESGRRAALAARAAATKVDFFTLATMRA
jgi:alpha-D-ribose 1-methylphosphonate 5-triphosphate synthase subunit PhnG